MAINYNFIKGNYLKYKLLAFSNTWFIVFDGKYNYMLFNWNDKRVQQRFLRNRLPYNKIGAFRMVEYYSTFDNALNNLTKKIVLGSDIN